VQQEGIIMQINCEGKRRERKVERQ